MRLFSSRYKFFFGFLLMLIALAFQSCKEAPKYGELEGMWQIMEVTDADGKRVNIREQRYFAFQGNVVQLRTEYGVGHLLTGNLAFDDPHLYLDFPYESTGKHPEELDEWGIDINPIKFVVTKLNSSTLEMTSTGGRHWRCRRF